MGYEELYDAMSDHNSKQQGEGYSEAIRDIINFLSESKQNIFTRKEVIELIEGFE